MNHTVTSTKNLTADVATRRQKVDEATVLFADIAGFVALSRRLGDAATFDLLDRLFSEFDVLCEWHGVEKVKTIGDGYMAVAGVGAGQANHAERVARLALDLQIAAGEVGAKLGIEITLRIGIATGSLTAGRMGLDKSSFDVWGTTVNLAARLEGRAGVRGILVSGSTARAIAGQFQCADSMTIDIRGIGPTEACVLEQEIQDWSNHSNSWLPRTTKGPIELSHA